MTDGGANTGSFVTYQGGLPPGKDGYANSRDPKNSFVFNYSYELPFGKGRRFLTAPQTFANKVLDKVVGGWTIAGITTATADPVGPWTTAQTGILPAKPSTVTRPPTRVRL